MRRAGRAERTPRTFCCATAPTRLLRRLGPAWRLRRRRQRRGGGEEGGAASQGWSRAPPPPEVWVKPELPGGNFFSFFPSLPGGGGGREATAGANASGLGVDAARTGGGGLAPRGEARPGGPEGGGEDRGLRVRRRRCVCPAQGRAPAPLPARLRGGGGGAGGCTWWRGAGGWPAAGTSWSRCWGCCCCWRAPAPGRWSACPATSPSAKSPGAAPGASCRASAAAATCAPARGTRAAAAPTGSTELATGGCAVSSAPRSMATPSPNMKWASAKVRPPAAGPLPPGPRHPLRASCAEQSLAETIPRREGSPGEGAVVAPGREPRVPSLPLTAWAPHSPSLAGPGEVGFCGWGLASGEITPWPRTDWHTCAHSGLGWVGWGGPALLPEVRAPRAGHCEGCREPLGESDPCHLPHTSAVWNQVPHTVREILCWRRRRVCSSHSL